VNLTIPKFKLDTSSSLIEPLKKLGVNKLFQPGADLSYLTDSSVYVSDVDQHTSIDVNEEGTILVSVARVVAVGLSVQRRLDTVEFIVDKPFIAMIVNTAQNIPYALCKITEPKY
jgi:serine protease inhibitor